MKVKTATDLLNRIPMPKTAEDFTSAWQRAEDLRKSVDHGSDSQEAKDRFDELVSLKQEEFETYWLVHKVRYPFGKPRDDGQDSR